MEKKPYNSFFMVNVAKGMDRGIFRKPINANPELNVYRGQETDNLWPKSNVFLYKNAFHS